MIGPFLSRNPKNALVKKNKSSMQKASPLRPKYHELINRKIVTSSLLMFIVLFVFINNELKEKSYDENQCDSENDPSQKFL